MMYTQTRYFALALMSGNWTREHHIKTLKALGFANQKATQLATRIHYFLPRTPLQLAQLAGFLEQDTIAQPWLESRQTPIPIKAEPTESPIAPSFVTFPIKQIHTNKDLCHWLEISPLELTWFTGRRSSDDAVNLPLNHYRYHWRAKSKGGQRLIEQPKVRLKQIQRKILQGILNKLPPHDCAHGFTRNRSIYSAAENHTGKQVILKMDLKDFFISIPFRRIYGLFLSLGYPKAVSWSLSRLTTHQTQLQLLGPEVNHLNFQQRQQHRDHHLPQGAPSSGALATLAAYGLDARLAGLAKSKDFSYSRYADDLIFSSQQASKHLVAWLAPVIASIALEEGFQINHRKTRIQLQGKSQRCLGMEINQKLNVPKAEYDQLKATLYNCVHQGPGSQNRKNHVDFQAHLRGKVQWVQSVNETKGLKLRRLFDQIQW